MKLHEKIYTLRTAKNLSQGDLAEMLDVSRQSVSKWETGASIPDLDKLVKMSDLFGVSLDALVRGEILENEPKTTENTQKNDENDEKTQKIVIVKETLPLRKLFGALLFIGSFVFLFLAWPLSIFMALLGVICFVFQKHTLLWCAWFTYFCADIFTFTGTSISRRAVFSPIAYREYGIRMVVHWAYLLILIALIAWTVYTFRHAQYAVTARRKVFFALGWIGSFGLLPLLLALLSFFVSKKVIALTEAADGVFEVGSALYEQSWFYLSLLNNVGFVFEWIQIVILPILLIISVSWLRLCREKKKLS